MAHQVVEDLHRFRGQPVAVVGSDSVPQDTRRRIRSGAEHESTLNGYMVPPCAIFSVLLAVSAAPLTERDSGFITGGVATYFYQNDNAGACGTVHSDNDVVAAMDSGRYNQGLCGKKVFIRNTKNGKSVTVTIADECPTCENSNSIDLSVGAFTQIATKEEGEVPIQWKYV